jgi:hypothetical protein
MSLRRAPLPELQSLRLHLREKCEIRPRFESSSLLNRTPVVIASRLLTFPVHPLLCSRQNDTSAAWHYVDDGDGRVAAG